MATGDKLRGEDYVVQLDTTADHVTPAYATIGGLRSNGMNLTMEDIDVSDKASSGWSDALAGIRTMEVTGSGIMTEGDATLIEFVDRVQNRTKSWFKILNAYGDYYEGQFYITAYNESGDYNGEHSYEFTLKNSGAVAYTAGP